jgi:hypothetical protein
MAILPNAMIPAKLSRRNAKVRWKNPRFPAKINLAKKYPAFSE